MLDVSPSLIEEDAGKATFLVTLLFIFFLFQHSNQQEIQWF